MKKLVFVLFTSLFLFSCDPKAGGIQGPLDTYVPIYASMSEVEQISVEPEKATAIPGKIYAFGNYVFQNDLYTGIHIIDNSNHDAPVKVGFLNLPLNTEMAIKGNYLYANNYVDLVVFDITFPDNPQFVTRVPNVFPPVDQDYPPFTNVYFQCPDKSKGIVIRWEKQDIPVPKCRR